MATKQELREVEQLLIKNKDKHVTIPKRYVRILTEALEELKNLKEGSSDA